MNVTTNGPLLAGDDYVRPSFTKIVNKPETARRKRPPDLWASPTDRTTFSSTVRRDLAETYPWYGSHDGAYWSLLEKGVGTSSPQPDLSALRMKLRAKVKGKNANLAETMAEYRQTGTMFLDMARSVIHTYRSLRKGKPWWAFRDAINRDRKGFAKGISDRLLEFNFGARPLVEDLFNATEVVLKNLQGGFYQYESAKVKADSFLDSTIFTKAPAGRVYKTYELDAWSNRAKGEIRWKVSYPDIKTLSDLGFTNPLSLAWDLTPYSFVVDQIIPIGQTLASLDALVGVTDLQWKLSGEERYSGLLSVTGGLKPGEATTQMVRRYRSASVMTDLPIPIPAYRPSKMWQQLVTNTALLTQLQRNIK